MSLFCKFFSGSYCHDFSVRDFQAPFHLVLAHLISFLWVSVKSFAISHVQIFRPSVSLEIPTTSNQPSEISSLKD